MITEFNISNYKSVEKLTLKLGRVNIFIGENGSGKSNVLEAIALASAATEGKLDNEFLAARGIRVTNPPLMRAAFEKENVSKAIELSFQIANENYEYALFNDNQPYSKWELDESSVGHKIKKYRNNFKLHAEKVKIFTQRLNEVKELEELKEEIEHLRKEEEFIEKIKEELITVINLTNFLIYAPENTALRTFEKEGQIEPLGIHGEGLFKFLKYLAAKGHLDEIKDYLKLFGWFRDFAIPENLFAGESHLRIKDRYLHDDIAFFDQKSANEGFLFVLFYMALMVGDKTPNFFAIDNIETALNPKLCTKIVKTIAELAKKHNKQVIMTTHNPAALDGLDLNDEDQKLFLVYRNKLGHTAVRNVQKPVPLEGQEPVKLSEAFLRGYIGGLPKNFSI